jgi:hypothetical protein
MEINRSLSSIKFSVGTLPALPRASSLAGSDLYFLANHMYEAILISMSCFRRTESEGIVEIPVFVVSCQK